MKTDVPLPGEAQAALRRLGERLRATRFARGWTVAETSARLGCSPTTWRAVEQGRAGTGIGLLAHALWLFGTLDSLDAAASIPAGPAPLRRVRRPAHAAPPGRIQPDELDF